MFPELSFEEPPPPPPRGGPLLTGVNAWVAHIREQDMPAFGSTVTAVQAVTGDEKASAGRLAQAILQDAAMTAKVLKLANSAFYNTRRQSVSTISRAIVVLGFDVVAEIALGLSLVDALRGGVRSRVAAEMARSFHAAAQARALAVSRRDPRAEEVFIAALLARVGEMAFWCFGGAQAEKLDAALKASALPAEEVQMQVLGFKLKHLSMSLAKEWKLGPLLSVVLEPPARPDATEEALLLGHRIADAVEKGGWQAPATRRLLDKVAEYCGDPAEEVHAQIADTATAAARMAVAYGATEAAHLIPLPDAAAAATLAEEEADAVPDPLLQLRILRELSSLIGSGGSLNEVLNLTLEGIYRGIGFPRVLFALLAPNRSQLIGKAALGRGAELMCQRFNFGFEAPPGDVVNEVMQNRRALCLSGPAMPRDLRLDRLRGVTGANHAVIAPIVANGRAVGLFYADRPQSDEIIEAEQYDAFLHFVQHVSLAFANLSSAPRKA